MKITIQNGAAHGLSRRDLEAIIPLFPKAWAASIQQIVLYQGQGPGVRAEFYPKKQLLGFFWPADVASVSKMDGLEELLVALSVASERGEIPEHLAKATRERHVAEVAGILASCLEGLHNAA